MTTGSDKLEELLFESGVTTVFTITGAGNIAVVDAICRMKRIQLVYSHHEQAAVMEAQGFARVTGKPGVVIVTTGGGTTNAVTGILSAHLDSVPVMIISGNESSYNINAMRNMRAVGVQGFDSVSMIGPICKSSKRVSSLNDLAAEFHSAWSLMCTPRRGPVHLDFPMDLQRSAYNPEAARFKPFDDKSQRNGAPLDRMTKLSAALEKCRRPLFYLGNGLRGEVSLERLGEWFTKNTIPYVLSWSALDFFPSNEQLNVGRVGIYGDRAANLVVQQCDLLICVGTRLAIPQVGYDRNDFARRADRYVIDIDESELTKFDAEQWSLLHISAKDFFDYLFSVQARTHISSDQWMHQIASLKRTFPQHSQIGFLDEEDHTTIHSFEAVKAISRVLPSNSTVVTDVGAALLTGHFALEVDGTQRVFTSQGLGEMGFGLPGAIGAYFGDPTRSIICLNTDGGIMMNLQELELVSFHKIPLKLFVFNNGGYTMIKTSQQNLFQGRFAGVDRESGLSFPDFGSIAMTFGFKYSRISNRKNLQSQCASAINSDLPELVDLVMSPSQKYFPRLATNKRPDGTLISPPIEDLEPQIPLEVLRKALGYAPSQSSLDTRGAHLG